MIFSGLIWPAVWTTPTPGLGIPKSRISRNSPFSIFSLCKIPVSPPQVTGSVGDWKSTVSSLGFSESGRRAQFVTQSLFSQSLMDPPFHEHKQHTFLYLAQAGHWVMGTSCPQYFRNDKPAAKGGKQLSEVFPQILCLAQPSSLISANKAFKGGTLPGALQCGLGHH